MLPSLFLSHGAPTLPLDDCPARDFLTALGETLPRPRAVLVASAHWDNSVPTVNRVVVNETIHDFYGFPPALYGMLYPAPGSEALAERSLDLLEAAGFATTGADAARGLDHGAWVPLMLMYPKADIPVVQLSIQSPLGPEHHVRLGRALETLRHEDVLVIGTGSFTHNLRTMARGQLNAPEPAWSCEFSDWIHAAILDRRVADLLAYRGLAPHAAQAHPTEDHFLPLFVALGAGGEGAKPERLHRSTTFGSLRMDCYAFN
jgi:4,5-DOPA dioxygenase extradiol